MRKVALKDWRRRFDDPIALPGGRALVTLADAAGYIQELPEAEQLLEDWQTAIEILIGAAEGRDLVMHARIAVSRAINRDSPPPPEPRRKRAKAYKIVR